jgi:simple sugar transport system substrate-binding protein
MYKNLAAASRPLAVWPCLGCIPRTHHFHCQRACQGGAAATPVKAAFVYVTPVLDAGWTTQHDAGRRQLQTQLGDQVQTTVVADVAEGPMPSA